MNISVPDDLYEKAIAMARMQQIPVDEVFASAFAQQAASWERVRERADRGNRDRFLAVLDKVPDVDPPDFDRL